MGITSSQPTQPVQPKKVKSLLDDDDEDTQPTQPQPVKPPIVQTQQFQQPKASDPFDILGLDIGGIPAVTQPKAVNINNGGDLLGGFNFGTQPQTIQTPQPVVNQNIGFDLFDDGSPGNRSVTKPIIPTYIPPPQTQTQTQSFGFDFLGTSNNNNVGISLGNTQPVQQPTQSFNQFVQPVAQQLQQQTFKFKAYETAHV